MSSFCELQIDINSLEDALHEISTACMRGVQALPSSAISTRVRDEVRLLAATVHVAKGLKSEDLRKRHWVRIGAFVPGLPADCSRSTLCFGDLGKLGVIDAQDRCSSEP